MPEAEERIRGFLSREFPALRVRPSAEPLADLEIEAAHPATGPVLIQFQPDEITFFIGDHTHCHFESDNEVGALDFLRALFEDRLVIWKGFLASGLSERISGSRARLPWVKEFVWSGPLR